LWKSPEKAKAAAEALGITAERLRKLGLVDEVIPEPLGGAHRDIQAIADSVKNALLNAISEVQALSSDQLIEQRRNRLAAYGVYNEG
jgi:acetyl-CoA carboxylase carboxyl transferase subunit alpha